MLGLFIGIIAGSAFIVFNVYEKIKYTKKIDALKEQYKYVQRVNASQRAVLFNAIMAGLAVGLGAINLSDLTSVGISFALISAFIGNILAAQTHRNIVFFEKGFAHDGTYIRYKSIQSITPIKKGKKFKVLFLNQTSVVLDQETIRVLEECRKKK